MTTMHASAAAVSTATNNPTSSANITSPSSLHSNQSHHRRYSSNSLSSSSTVKRVGSPGSVNTAARNSAVPMRPQSPEDRSLIALRVGRDNTQPEQKRYRNPGASAEQLGNTEGLGNINRWSRSTNSSSTSSVRQKGPADSAADLATLSNSHYSPQKRSKPKQGSPLSSPHKSHIAAHVRSSPEASPDRQYRRSPRQSASTALPPLHTTPALTDPNDTDSPSTIQTVATPSNNTYMPEYFADGTSSPRKNMRDIKSPPLIRNHTAPLPGHTRVPGSEDSQNSTQRSQTPDDGTGRRSSRRDSSGKRNSYTREGREKDKKAMLSKALQKANTAVLLDNAANFEGALDAYNDACRLLQQVMDRSSAPEDKRKLEAIRVTYSNRIEELQELDRATTHEDKSLPARPMSDDSTKLGAKTLSPMSANFDQEAVQNDPNQTPRLASPSKTPESFFTKTMEAVSGPQRHDTHVPQEAARNVGSFATSEVDASGGAEEEHQHLHQSPLDEPQYIPAPLLPRKSDSPVAELQDDDEAWQRETELELEQTELDMDQSELEPYDEPEASDNDAQPTSWLDTIDESDADSDRSSMHSMGQRGVRRKHLRGESNPSFDAAFDAAVEAAYDEGFEPDLEARKKRETMQRIAQEQYNNQSQDGMHGGPVFYDARQRTSAQRQSDEDAEEERMLDEITSDFGQTFQFDYSNKSALPRQSDSSGYSRSTWQSSQGDRTTAATSLSTVAEDTSSSRYSQKSMAPSSASTVRPDLPLPPPPPPPPTGGLPSLPQPKSMNQNRLSGVRDRRLSGQSNLKQLKIETAPKSDTRKRASTFHHTPSPRKETDTSEFKFGSSLDTSSSNALDDQALKSPPALDIPYAVSDNGMRTPNTNGEPRERDLPEMKSGRPNIFRKNKSSMSLRTADHNLFASSPDHELPSATPMSSTFMSFASKARSQDPLTVQRAKFPSFDAGVPSAGGAAAGGAYLFDTSLSADQSPNSPRSPTSQPTGLEPCPESFLLRPFWLMRALASTLVHPRGGFVTTRLFVPREVWQTRGVKLKSVEDKVANLDYLTAALGRLAGVDTFDADAVMEELQGFEEVMERVQAALTKKLGSEVGVHGLAGMFKDAAASSGPAAGGPYGHGHDATTGAEQKTKSKEGGKSSSYLSSWRKLRSKSSGAPLGHVAGSAAAGGAHASDKDRELPTMASVPMTNFMPVERRGGKKDARNTAFEGPHREYMSSLARLFESAQILDQIARQVEDPGLKHSSPTHVGLELSIRHAAEFFGFYVCRFVLGDVGLLMDKYVKRGSEWVLA